MLINDAQMREKMGENSRNLAEKEFSIKSVVQKHIEIYTEIVKQ